MEKVSVETIKPWISQRICELLGFEDEVVIDFVFNMLENQRVSALAARETERERERDREREKRGREAG